MCKGKGAKHKWLKHRIDLTATYSWHSTFDNINIKHNLLSSGMDSNNFLSSSSSSIINFLMSFSSASFTLSCSSIFSSEITNIFRRVFIRHLNKQHYKKIVWFRNVDNRKEVSDRYKSRRFNWLDLHLRILKREEVGTSILLGSFENYR